MGGTCKNPLCVHAELGPASPEEEVDFRMIDPLLKFYSNKVQALKSEGDGSEAVLDGI